MAESAFIVRVPEAESYVAHLRARLDPSAKAGMPAHITLLYPFMSPELVNAAVLERVRAAVADAREFAFNLARVKRFPGVLYIAPEPAAPFAELTRGLVKQFPTFPPYGGQYEGVVPHLTVGHTDGAEQTHVETELTNSLPSSVGIACSCSELALFGNASGRWQQMHVFPLASTPHAAG